MQMAWNTYIYTYQSQATRDSLQTDHTSYHGSFVDCKILTILPSFHFSQNLHLPPSFLLGYPPFHCQNPHPLPSFVNIPTLPLSVSPPFSSQNLHLPPSFLLESPPFPVRIPTLPIISLSESPHFPVRIPLISLSESHPSPHFPVRILSISLSESSPLVKHQITNT